MDKEAVFIGKLEGWQGDARLYSLSEPVEYTAGFNSPLEETEFVVVSAIETIDGQEETFIFPASSGGTVLDWSELDGSFKGGRDHKKALEGLGFTTREE